VVHRGETSPVTANDLPYYTYCSRMWPQKLTNNNRGNQLGFVGRITSREKYHGQWCKSRGLRLAGIWP